MEKLRTLLTLAALPGVGPKTVAAVAAILDMGGFDGAADLVSSARDGGVRLKNFSARDFSAAAERAEKILADSAAAGIAIVALFDEAYPSALKKIADPPPALFVRGGPAALLAPRRAAVVGMRAPSAEGAAAAFETAASLARRNVAVISGLARGCDTRAHEGCLAAGGLTAAVVAHGPDLVYPPENDRLAAKIVESGGCVVSEYPPRTAAFTAAFVARDRLQSGLSECVVIAETDIRGGAMHTARFAREQGRRLFCFEFAGRPPGDALCEGNRFLISGKTAAAVSSPADVEKAMGF